VAGVLAPAAALVAHVVVLARQPAASRALLDHVGRGVQTAGLEAPLDLWLDLPSAVACGLACAVAGAAAVLLATGPTFERTWTRWVWLQLALLGALLAFLADGLATVAAGWALACLAGVWLAGWRDPGRGIAAASWGACAIAAQLLGAALLFWGIGGTWDAEGYLAEAEGPVAAARVAGRPGQVTVTMTAPAGARVFVDGAKTQGLSVPFVRAWLGAGPHGLRVEGMGDGEGGEAYFTAADGDDVVLVPLRPTLSLHVLRDALGLRDRRGEPAVRREVESHVAPGGVSLVAGVLLLWVAAIGALSAIHVPLAAPGLLVGLAAGASTSMLGPFLLLRAEFLFPSALHTGVVVACAGAAIVLGATWRALAHDDLPRWLVFSRSGASGLMCVVLGLGGAGKGLAGMAVIGAGAAAVHLSTARRVFARDREPVDGTEETFLIRWPERLGALLATMERWVIGSVADAAGGAARIAAWMVAAADEHVVATPPDRVADGVLRATHAVRPLVGGALVPLVWGLAALGAAAALLHALWPGG
jgi:hypothetical protein